MRAIAIAAAVSAALVLGYLALGGASYAPAQVADPCATRDWRGPEGLSEVAEQIVLSSLDGVACELGVTREEVVLAFESDDELEAFARREGIDDEELEELVRTGLDRAIDDAERADAIGPTTARLLRALVDRIPVQQLLDLPGFLPAIEGLLD
jgi:hypothetical protein